MCAQRIMARIYMRPINTWKWSVRGGYQLTTIYNMRSNFKTDEKTHTMVLLRSSACFEFQFCFINFTFIVFTRPLPFHIVSNFQHNSLKKFVRFHLDIISTIRCALYVRFYFILEYIFCTFCWKCSFFSQNQNKNRLKKK